MHRNHDNNYNHFILDGDLIRSSSIYNYQTYSNHSEGHYNLLIMDRGNISLLKIKEMPYSLLFCYWHSMEIFLSLWPIE